MANGGADFLRATSFGTFRLPGSRGVYGDFTGDETQEWFKINVAGRNLKFGSFSYSTTAGGFGEDSDVIPTVNLFFRARNRGALRRIDSFPGNSNEASSFFAIRSTGTFYVQVLGTSKNYYSSFSLSFSASTKDFDAFR